MKKVLRSLIALLGLLEFSRWVMRTYGKSSEPDFHRDPLPKSLNEIRADLQFELPGEWQVVIGIAINYQMAGDDEAAEREYAKIREVPRADGSFYRLGDHSRSFQHNLNLLESSKTRPKTSPYLSFQFQGQLPKEYLRTFDRAVKYQMVGNFAAAKQEYGKIRWMRTTNGQMIDLSLTAKAFSHNLRLMGISSL